MKLISVLQLAGYVVLGLDCGPHCCNQLVVLRKLNFVRLKESGKSHLCLHLISL